MAFLTLSSRIIHRTSSFLHPLTDTSDKAVCVISPTPVPATHVNVPQYINLKPHLELLALFQSAGSLLQ